MFDEAYSYLCRNISELDMQSRVTPVKADVLGDLSGVLPDELDVIVSNPPYITGADMAELDDSVKLFEPHLALFGGEDGLDFYRSIAVNFTAALKPGGFLCLEFGDDQGDDVCRILEENGYTILERSRD